MTGSSKQCCRDGDLSNEQVALLVEQCTGQTNRIADIDRHAHQVPQAGGKDRVYLMSMAIDVLALSGRVSWSRGLVRAIREVALFQSTSVPQ